MQFGLLGKKLGHSFSPQIHALLGDYPYRLYEKQPEELADFLKSGDFSGLNVTNPYKKAVIEYCAELSPIARRLGAVNTIVRKEDGSLIGHNTDYSGFQRLLNKSGIALAGREALVLGAGGASGTVTAVLEESGATVHVISHKDNCPETLARYPETVLLVNATPVGMYPANGEAPADIRIFPKLECVLDLIYNPMRTQLLLDAEALGIAAIDGLEMLVAQAKESAEWFTGHKIDDSRIDTVFDHLRRKTENIILVGMPGSGKTAIATVLAEKLGRIHLDTDAYLTEKVGRSIEDIFATDGEEVFRKLETEVLRELGKRSGCVISTGGGCVTRPENYNLLHQNGVIFRICRDLEMLPTAGRPMMQHTTKAALLQARDPLYDRFADYRVDNNSTVEAAAAEILRILEATHENPRY